MVRVLNATLALFLALGGFVAVPSSRIDTGRDSSAIVWIAAEERETCVVVPPAARRNPAPAVCYTPRIVRRDPIHTLFQRPPPAKS